MTIIEFKNSKDITIEFENGYILKGRYPEFKTGEIKYPYDKRVYNIGYHGVGEYKVSINQKHTKQYNYWYDMLKRCYCQEYIVEHATYAEKIVCDEWHNFQTFAKWFDDNYYEIEGDRIELDKDILFRGNNIYSPETCTFIPKRINTLFLKCDASRGNTPIGVDEKNGRFMARCNTFRNRVTLGSYSTAEEAFNSYKIFKEKYIKEVADLYRNVISKDIYEAMYRYEVRITD